MISLFLKTRCVCNYKQSKQAISLNTCKSEAHFNDKKSQDFCVYINVMFERFRKRRDQTFSPTSSLSLKQHSYISVVTGFMRRHFLNSVRFVVSKGGGVIMKDELGRILNKTAAYFHALLPNLPGRIQAFSSSKQKPIISMHLMCLILLSVS